MFYDNGIMFNYEGKTSGIKNFMTETFLANKWVKAPKGLIYKFFDTIKSIYAKIDANITESNALIKQRDELLLLLMNGQATVNYDLLITEIQAKVLGQCEYFRILMAGAWMRENVVGGGGFFFGGKCGERVGF